MPAGRSRKTGSGSSRHKLQKRSARGKFEARHIDQVFEDYAKQDAGAVCDGKTGPLGTTTRAHLDEDVPGGGKHYCLACSRYFTDAGALKAHQRTKPHKRRVGELAKLAASSSKPHSAADAERAGGMGAPDNGPQLRSGRAALPMDEPMAT